MRHDQLDMFVPDKTGKACSSQFHCTQVFSTLLHRCYIASKLLEDDMGESLKHEDFKNWDYDLEAIDGSLVVKHKRVFNNFLN